jgi:DNA-directed RNA polymerase specialized sigma24 family protein
LKASLEHWPVHLSARDDPRGAAATPESLPGTLAQIYDAHFDFVWRNARRLGVPEASADDVAQDVFMIVHRRIADYDGRAPLQAWIFGILVRVARDQREIAEFIGSNTNTIHSRLRAAKRAFEKVHARALAGKEDTP